jgi:hypothetical protein
VKVCDFKDLRPFTFWLQQVPNNLKVRTLKVNEISSLRCDFLLNVYPEGFIDSVINSKGNSYLTKEEKSLGSLYIPYVKGGSEKFKCIGNRYNIRRSSKLNTLFGVHL